MQKNKYVCYEVDMNNIFENLQVYHNKCVTIMNTQLLKEKSEISNSVLSKYNISDSNSSKQVVVNVKALLQTFSNLFQTSCVLIETSCASAFSLLQYASKFATNPSTNKPTYSKLQSTVEELTCIY